MYTKLFGHHLLESMQLLFRGRKWKSGGQASLAIPGRVFAFITVRRTTRPGTSCLRMSIVSQILAISIFSFTFVTIIFMY